MTEWRKTTLGELISVKHGYAFKGEFFAQEGEAIVLTPGNFRIGGGLQFRQGKERYYTGSYPPEFKLSPGELLVVMTDLKQDAPILGSPAFVPDYPPVLHNQRLGLVSAKPGVEVDSRFLFYLMASDGARSQLRATATGTTVRHTAPERIYHVQVSLPPVGIQRSIGSILSAIDDLIENNRHRVELLEQTAQAVYREWFINFRYPGHEEITLVDSPLGSIPDGWDVMAVSKLLEVNPRLRLNKDAEHPFITMSDLSDQSMDCFPSNHKTGASGAKFQNGDTLFARITPCLENGKTGLVQCLEGDEIGRGSTEFVVLRGRLVGPAFTYLLARDDRFRRNAIQSMSGASGRQRVRNECFDSYLVASPPVALAQRFEQLCEPSLILIHCLSRSNRVLATMRDYLLPRLVSGQIDVSSLVLDAVVEHVA